MLQPHLLTFICCFGRGRRRGQAHRCFRTRVAMRDSAEAQPASNGVPGLSRSMTRCVIRGDRFSLPRLAIDLGPNHAVL